jgi:hypothetical protein
MNNVRKLHTYIAWKLERPIELFLIVERHMKKVKSAQHHVGAQECKRQIVASTPQIPALNTLLNKPPSTTVDHI